MGKSKVIPFQGTCEKIFASCFSDKNKKKKAVADADTEFGRDSPGMFKDKDEEIKDDNDT